MRISLNLATRPFVEIRPLLARLRLAMLVLALAAIGLGVWAHALADRAALATAQMDSLKQQTAAVNAERARNERRMHEPANSGTLERARFLNALFAEKSFSWTAVMMDLERVLPPGVQVTSIEPNITKEGDVLIRLRVTGDRDRSVELVRNLERSQRFASPRLAGETALTADRAKALGGVAPVGTGPATVQTISSPQGSGTLVLGNGVEFEIFSGYVPLPERLDRLDHKKGALGARDVMVPDVTEMTPPEHNRRPTRPGVIPGAAPVPAGQAHKPSPDTRMPKPPEGAE